MRVRERACRSRHRSRFFGHPPAGAILCRTAGIASVIGQSVDAVSVRERPPCVSFYRVALGLKLAFERPGKLADSPVSAMCESIGGADDDSISQFDFVNTYAESDC